MRFSRNYQVVIACGLLVVLGSQGMAAVPDYSKQVAPILKRYCGGCHNDDDTEGKLSLESFAALQRGGKNGAALLPGDSKSSRLIRLVTGQAKPTMPPPDNAAPSEAEIEILKAWIDGGAKGPKGAGPDPGLLLVPRLKPAVQGKPITAIAWSPLGTVMAIARYGVIELQEVATGKVIRAIKGLPGKINALEFSADGSQLLSASGTVGLYGVATLWTVADGKQIRQFKGHRDTMYAATLSRDGKTLATSSYDQRIILWNAANGKQLRTLAGHNGAVFDVAFHPDGKVLASASGDETVKLWHVDSGQRLDTRSEPLDKQYVVTFSPDGRFVVAGGADNRIRVWKFVSRSSPQINPLVYARYAHEGPIVDLEFSSDGKALLSVAEDRTLKLLETSQFTQVFAYERQPDVVPALAVAPDSKSFVVARMDGSLGKYALKLATDATQVPPVTSTGKGAFPVSDSTDWRPLKLVPGSQSNGLQLKNHDDGSVSVTSSNGPTLELQGSVKLENITALRIEALLDDQLPAKGPGLASDGSFTLTGFSAWLGSKSQDVRKPLLIDTVHDESNLSNNQLSKLLVPTQPAGWQHQGGQPGSLVLGVSAQASKPGWLGSPLRSSEQDTSTTMLNIYYGSPLPAAGTVDRLRFWSAAKEEALCGLYLLRPTGKGTYHVLYKNEFKAQASNGQVEHVLPQPWQVQRGDLFAHSGNGGPAFYRNTQSTDVLYYPLTQFPGLNQVIKPASYPRFKEKRQYYLQANFSPLVSSPLASNLRFESGNASLTIKLQHGAAEKSLGRFRISATDNEDPLGIYFESSNKGGLDELQENEPNDTPDLAFEIKVPAAIKGTIDVKGEDRGQDEDLFRFAAKAGEQWIVEVNAARSKSPLDSRIEILTVDGQRIERLLLQAVRDSYFTFRGKDSSTSNDYRVHNWREMELNEYLYASGEVVKLWLYPRGPDSGFKVYPGSGKRYNYFDTTATSHALNSPCYIVQPHPPETRLIPNGLPVFPLYYENDDESRRELGTDSRLTFTAPEDGQYLVRLVDTRGFQGEKFSYTLTVRPRRPDFTVSVGGTNPKVSPGSGREFSVTAKRRDGFDGPIQVHVGELPPGFQVTTPLVIQAGQNTALGTITALADAAKPAMDVKPALLTATAEIAGKTVTRKIGNLGKIELAAKPKVFVHVEQAEGDAPQDWTAEKPLELEIQPGETIMARVRVERNNFKARISFGNEDSGRNLPHGVYVDNIGLNGLLIVEGKNERNFFITAAKWVPATTRVFHLMARVDGNQTSLPVILHVRPPK